MTEMNAELLARLVVGRTRDGRCRYDPLAKQALVGECLKPGVSLARVAVLYVSIPVNVIADSGNVTGILVNVTEGRCCAS